jgi:hypothetical protein
MQQLTKRWLNSLMTISINAMCYVVEEEYVDLKWSIGM